jgi:hypothetical protein
MKYILSLAMLLSLFSCKKDKQSETGLEGNWKATQWQNDIGDGSTPYSDIPASYNYYMKFAAGNSFESNYILNASNYNRYLVTGANTITLYNQNTTDSLKIRYEQQNNNTLIVSFLCIEPCNVKLTRN